jgi:hypothetical protein
MREGGVREAGMVGGEGVGLPPGAANSIVSEAFSLLESHLMTGERWNMSYYFYRPSLIKYGPDQWLWDGGSHEIVWANRNVSNSVQDLRTMLQLQQADGRIPEEIFWNDTSPLDWVFWSSDESADLTQMPVLPYSLRAIWNASQDAGLVAEFLPKLVRYLEWWNGTRADPRDGLARILHPWESGMDASPAYDAVWNVTNVTYWSL